MDFWIMVGIVIFVFIGQAILWSWVIIQRNKVAPDVKIFNWRELSQAFDRWLAERQRRRQNRSYR
ncbi:hypothetical protein [Chloroflexus sp.]|jgi:hypothetical protein|uniref:hypothetical protein n=1 Tax=Chloroflexus sp. TaxID=1904827 RepID=UPI0021DF4041|nr:hypothetical protein [Chloroflexus sp.]GIV89452.1 MAG: hypothetical protein KatS3mg055_1970 [Chloroflexus sp.]